MGGTGALLGREGRVVYLHWIFGLAGVAGSPKLACGSHLLHLSPGYGEGG
jgi:hypothetical protein